MLNSDFSNKRSSKIMGVLNVTPDSFSDGGLFFADSGEFLPEIFLKKAAALIEDGAEILDVGGESSGPGSFEVSLEEELHRVLPAIRILRANFPSVNISIDTWKSEVAAMAIKAGANMVNDISAGRFDENILKVVGAESLPYFMMYSKDNSARTSKEAKTYSDVMETIKMFFENALERAQAYGISDVILDPGMGAFVSTLPEYSWEILDRIEELYVFGKPILVGASRKSFLGEDRLGATMFTAAFLRDKVDFLRVHDALENATASL